MAASPDQSNAVRESTEEYENSTRKFVNRIARKNISSGNKTRHSENFMLREKIYWLKNDKAGNNTHPQRSPIMSPSFNAELVDLNILSRKAQEISPLGSPSLDLSKMFGPETKQLVGGVDQEQNNQHLSNQADKQKPMFYQKKKSKQTVKAYKISWVGAVWPNIKDLIFFGSYLGEGSFAKVYKGMLKDSQTPVAIKVIKKSKMESTKRKNMVQNEIDVLAKMDHNNISKLINVFEDMKRVCS